MRSCSIRRRVYGRLAASVGLAAWLVGSILFSGCMTVGPDHTTPHSAPLHGNFQSPPPAGLPDPALDQWWAHFNDPVLQQLVMFAGQQNLTLQEAHWRIEAARRETGIVSSRLYPNIDGHAGYQYSKRSLNAQPYVAENGNPFDLFRTGYDTTWEIDLFGRIRRQREAAVADMQASIEDKHDLQRLLAADIATSYVNARLQHELLEIRQRYLTRDQQAGQIASAQFEAGKVGRLDVVQANARIYQTATELPAYEEQLGIETTRLCLLLGQNNDGRLRSVFQQGRVPVPSLIDIGVPADLLHRRPDVRRAEREVAAASARIGVAESDFYPRLGLLGTISLSSRNASELFARDSIAFGLGPSLQWNILQYGRIENNVGKNCAQWKAALARYQQTTLVAVQEVEAGLIAYHRGRERVEVLERASQAAEMAIVLAKQQYESGQVDYQRFLSAQSRALEAAEELAVARASVALALIQVYKAAGGGWKPLASCCPPQPITTTQVSPTEPGAAARPQSGTSGNGLPPQVLGESPMEDIPAPPPDPAAASLSPELFNSPSWPTAAGDSTPVTLAPPRLTRPTDGVVEDLRDQESDSSGAQLMSPIAVPTVPTPALRRLRPSASSSNKTPRVADAVLGVPGNLR